MIKNVLTRLSVSYYIAIVKVDNQDLCKPAKHLGSWHGIAYFKPFFGMGCYFEACNEADLFRHVTRGCSFVVIYLSRLVGSCKQRSIITFLSNLYFNPLAKICGLMSGI